jgi:protocatechuate 3,4-dioxygenase, alpha subunit
MALGLTPSQTVGPFFGFALPYQSGDQLVDPSDSDAITIAGHVVDGAGDPVSDCMIEVWQADRQGRYAHPADTRTEPPLEEGFSGFGRLVTDSQGLFSFITVKPGPVPGPQGAVQAPHIDVGVFARGLMDRLVTRIYFPDEARANARDPILSSIADPGLRETLIARGQGSRLTFDIHLQGDLETAFFAV